MGIKGDKKATSDQARLAKLTLEGNSGNEEDMQLMIRTIIETTGCTQSQAEIALLDSNNSLYGAIDHILESGDKLDSWTEQKGAKKEKKKQDEGSYNNRGYVVRGRGNGTGDRSIRGRSNGAPRESRDNIRENRDTKEGGAPRSTRGGHERPYVGRGGRGGSRGGYSRAVAPSTTIEADAFAPELDENSTKVDTTVTEIQPPVEESVTTTVPTSSAPAPISFAAVAAAAHRKEALRKQQAQNPQPKQPPRRSLSPQPPLPSVGATTAVKEDPVVPTFSEPETSHQKEKEDGFFQSESSALAEEQTPNVSTHHDENVQSSPEQTNQAWTTQLKTDLGIGLNDAPGLRLSSPIQNAAPVQAIPDPGVEFVGTAPTNVHDYSFGFVEAPPSPQIPSTESSAASISNVSENIFNSTRIIPKQVEPERTAIPNGDYNLKSSSPPMPSYNQSNRGLSYDTSSASYPPTDRMASNKSQFNNSGQLPSQQPQQQQPAQQQQQATPPAQPPQAQTGHPQHPQHMLFTPQLPYGPYMNSYMNMYSPMPGVNVRDEQYAALMQYGMGVDLTNLSTILPQSAALSQSAAAQQVQSGQQRETHGLMDFNKFGSQSSRDQQSQQPANVGPPPGFQATNYMQQPNLSSLFMQQPYPSAPHTFGFMNMMPNVGSNAGGRQMYGQDDERKSYDKMAGSKPSTQQNQHSQYQHNGGNIGKYGNMNNKTYSWNN